jgi:hypothetical protein
MTPPRIVVSGAGIRQEGGGRLEDDADLHGPTIVRTVLEHTGGEVRLWPATLYGSLEGPAEAGLVRELGEGEVPDDVSAQRRRGAPPPSP